MNRLGKKIKWSADGVIPSTGNVVPRAEPVNNPAERASGHAMSWRRISGRTAGEAGSRFAVTFKKTVD